MNFRIDDTRTISQLVAEGVTIPAAGGWVLQRWADGTLFVQRPGGEGTEVSPVALASALQRLFDSHF